MSALPLTTAGLYCPGCAPGDFPQPHICGQGNPVYSTGWCPICHVNYMGSHVCSQPYPVTYPAPSTEPIAPVVWPKSEPSCDHCFCLKQKTGWYEAKGTGIFPTRVKLKPHVVCCMCSTRRVKA